MGLLHPRQPDRSGAPTVCPRSRLARNPGRSVASAALALRGSLIGTPADLLGVEATSLGEPRFLFRTGVRRTL